MAIEIKNDFYIQLTIDAGVDLTSATSVEILYQKPDGSKDSWTASASGTNAVYVFTQAELNMVGVWEMQVKFIIGGKTGYSSIDYYRIKKNLEIGIGESAAQGSNVVQYVKKETWLNVSGNSVTMSAAAEQQPTNKDYFVFVNLNGQERYHQDDAEAGELSWTYSNGVITFSGDISGYDVSAVWVYEVALN